MYRLPQHKQNFCIMPLSVYVFRKELKENTIHSIAEQ
jgi:hypothetical protein